MAIWNRRRFWDHVRTMCIGIPIVTSLTIIYSMIKYEVPLWDAFLTWVLYSVFMGLFLTPVFWWGFRKTSSANDLSRDDNKIDH